MKILEPASGSGLRTGPGPRLKGGCPQATGIKQIREQESASGTKER